MSTINLKCDLDQQVWSFDEVINNEKPTVDLNVGFDFESDEFNNLQFTLSIIDSDNKTVFEKSYPPPNAKYLTTDQEFIETERVSLSFESEYALKIWAVNGNKLSQGEYTIVRDKPSQPYPSWTWSGGKWNSPSPMPTDGQLYEWDEENLIWEQMTE